MLGSPVQVDDLSSLTIEQLVQRCAHSSSVDAWEEFVRRFHRLIAAVVLRTAAQFGDSSRQTTDDLIQETYLKLCADKFCILRNFKPQHPDAFLGYVRILAANVARDHFKASYSQKRGANQVEDIRDECVPAASEDSAGSAKSMERAVLIREIKHHLAFCVVGPEQERNSKIFWLHYRAGMSSRAIADLPGIGLSTKGVESIIIRITRELRERMAQPKRVGRNETPRKAEGIMPAESF
jgi:RNA polymerase sigma-70 factor (ECF subfamily)